METPTFGASSNNGQSNFANNGEPRRQMEGGFGEPRRQMEGGFGEPRRQMEGGFGGYRQLEGGFGTSFSQQECGSGVCHQKEDAQVPKNKRRNRRGKKGKKGSQATESVQPASRVPQNPLPENYMVVQQRHPNGAHGTVVYVYAPTYAIDARTVNLQVRQRPTFVPMTLSNGVQKSVTTQTRDFLARHRDIDQYMRDSIINIDNLIREDVGKEDMMENLRCYVNMACLRDKFPQATIDAWTGSVIASL